MQQEKRKRDWSQAEIGTYKKLLEHFGSDFKLLADQMNNIYSYQKMTASTIKTRWYSQDDPKKCRDEMKPDEAYELYDLYLQSLQNEDHHMWRNLQQKFQNRSMEILRNRFKGVILNLIRRMNYFYGPSRTQKLYNQRFRYFTNLTFNMLFYFGITDPCMFYREDRVLLELWTQVKKLWKLRLLEQDDYKFYCNSTIYQRTPHISQEDFVDMAEAVLTLEYSVYDMQSTINRLTMNQEPYYMKTRKKIIPKMKMLEEKQLEDVELVGEPMVSNTKRGRKTKKEIQMKGYKHNYNKPQICAEYNAKRMKEVYPVFTPLQRQMIERSDTAIKLLPVQALMDQQILKMMATSI